MEFLTLGAHRRCSVYSITFSALLGSFCAAVQFPFEAVAQTAPSRVVPQIVAPVQAAPDGSIVLPEIRSSGAPAGAEMLSVRLDRVMVEGGDPALEPEIAAITNPLAGQTVRVSDVYAAAAKIEALYVRKGLVLYRAIVPPQHLTNGATARIRVLNGFIESVDASAVPSRVRAAVAARAARLIGRRGLTLNQIERHLLLAGRVPGVVMESMVIPGQEEGGAVLVLNARWHPASGQISTDNRLGDSYRNANVDAQLVLNSVLGTAEQVYAVASSAPDFDLFVGAPLRRVAGVGAIVPVGTNGLTLNAEYIRADTNPRASANSLKLTGKLNRVAVRLRYPLGLTRREVLNVFGSFDMLSEGQRLRDFNLSLSRDRLRFLTVGLDWMRSTTTGGSAGVEVSIAQGLNIFRARDASDAVRSGVPLSRFGSHPDFTSISGSASVRRPLIKSLEAALLTRGQLSLSGALPSSAQFALDASDGLSGFFLGSLSVDSGLTLRTELSLPADSPMNQRKVSLTPYLFAATGWGRLAQPTALERRNIDGWSVGTGLRATFRARLSAYAELARSGANISRNSTRLTGGISFRF